MVTKSDNSRSKIKLGVGLATVTGCKRRRGWAGGCTFWKRTVVIMGESGGGSYKNVYCTYIWLWDRVLSLYGICLKQMKTKLS